jgi:hypothetical protein
MKSRWANIPLIAYPAWNCTFAALFVQVLIGFVMVRAQSAADMTTFLAACFAIVILYIASERLMVVPLERRLRMSLEGRR